MIRILIGLFLLGARTSVRFLRTS